MGDIREHHRDLKEHKKQRRLRRARHHGQKQANQSRKNDDDNNTNSNGNGSGNGNHNNNSNQRCWDWMLVGGTNHYAKNRSSFTTYRRAPCKIGGRTRVLGTGTVKLELVRGPSDPRTYTLVLDDVLHIPDAVCNGISISPRFMAARNYTVLDWRDMAVGDAETAEPVFYGRPFSEEGSMSRAVLAGDPKGASYLGDGEDCILSVHASEEELGALGRRVENRSL